MKTKILTALKTKYKNLGFGEKSFEGVADYLAATVTEESQIETAIGGVAPMLKALQSEADKLRGENATLKTQLEAAKKKEPGQTDPPGNEGSKTGGDETPEWAKAMMASHKTLTEKLAALEGEKVTAARKNRLDKLTEKLPEELRKPYTRMTVDTLTDEEFTQLAADVTSEVESISGTLAANGAVFNPPKGGGGNPPKEATKEEAANVINALI
jgi:hypothetical protein